MMSTSQPSDPSQLADQVKSLTTEAVQLELALFDDDCVIEWPDGTWCEPDEVRDYLWMSDDYSMVPRAVRHE